MENLLQLDGNILLWIQDNIRNDFLTPFFKGITTLGNAGWFWIVLSLMFCVFRKTRKIGFSGLLALLIGALFTNLCLKPLVARPRPYTQIPELHLLIARATDFSFPSGHSTASFAASVAYLCAIPKKRYAIPALVLAMLIAFSRLYVGIHYPTDVLCGTLIGIASGVLAWKLGVKIAKYFKHRKENKVED